MVHNKGNFVYTTDKKEILLNHCGSDFYSLHRSSPLFSWTCEDIIFPCPFGTGQSYRTSFKIIVC